MAKSSRYYQLTQNILLEYMFCGENPESSDYINLKNNSFSIIDNGYDSRRYFFATKTQDVFSKSNTLTNNSMGNLALPVNESRTKYVDMMSDGSIPYDEFIGSAYMKKSVIDASDWTSNGQNIPFDTIRLHFTGGVYMQDYDELLFGAHIYDRLNNKISLASIVFKKTDNLQIHENPLLINQRIYVNYVDIRIPSIQFLTTNSYAEEFISNALSTNGLKVHTSLFFNLYGVKNSYDRYDYHFYNSEFINEVNVPYKDKYDSVYVDIEEASDGDYFTLTAKCTGDTFSNFLYRLSNVDDTTNGVYTVTHDITLTEFYLDSTSKTPKVLKDITSNQSYTVSVSEETDDDVFDNPITFRPVVVHASTAVKFTIKDTLRIINSSDGTTIVKIATFDYYEPSKYGKRIRQINLGTQPIQANVYNSRYGSGAISSSDSLDTINIHQSNTKNTLESTKYEVTAFIESANIAISNTEITSY